MRTGIRLGGLLYEVNVKNTSRYQYLEGQTINFQGYQSQARPKILENVGLASPDTAP